MLYKNNETVRIKNIGIKGKFGLIKGVAGANPGGVMYIVELFDYDAMFDGNKYECAIFRDDCLELV